VNIFTKLKTCHCGKQQPSPVPHLASRGRCAGTSRGIILMASLARYGIHGATLRRAGQTDC